MGEYLVELVGMEILKKIIKKMFEVVILWVYIIRGDDICQKKKKIR